MENLKMKKWNLIIDLEKCEDCNNCFLACKDEYVDNDWPEYSLSQPRHGQRWINILRKERGQYPLIDVAYLPVPCMHCDHAPCIEAAKNNSVYKRDDGIVIIDPKKAKGQDQLVKACPYGAIWWNEEKDVPQKCTFCAHLLDGGWKEPRCVQACPTGAIKVAYAEDSEMTQVVAKENLAVLHPEYKSVPRVYYKNMYRFNSCFIAGSVAFSRHGCIDCAEGARVTLSKDAKNIAEMVTDNYGDYKFDQLEPNSGKYDLVLTYQSYEKKTLNIDLTESVNVGEVVFDET
jgi:Fe-S-cluster-containing dehydrogenase component